MLAALMLLGTLPAMMLYAAETILSINFEDETVGEKSKNTAISLVETDANNTVTVETDPKNPDNKVLKLNRTSKKTHALISFPEQTGVFVAEYRIMLEGNAQCAAILQQGTGNKNMGAYVLGRPGASDTVAHSLEYHDGSGWNVMFSGDEFKNGEWYSVTIEVDVANGRFNISVTDYTGSTKTASNVGFRNTGAVTALDYLDFQFAAAVPGTMYVDDIKIYAPNQTPVDPEPETPPTDPEPEPEPDPKPDPNPENPEAPQDTTALQTAINKVASDLAAAQTALNTAIENGDTALDAKITALNTALEAAKKAYSDADTAMQGALNSKIEAADATLDAAIKTVQKNLTDAITELEDADKTNAAAIAKAISDLNTAIESAEIASATADVAISDELSGMINAAEAALQTKLDALTTELQNVKKELEDKIKALENASGEPTATDEATDPLVIASMVISCVSICGCVVLAALYTSNKKKKA